MYLQKAFNIVDKFKSVFFRRTIQLEIMIAFVVVIIISNSAINIIYFNNMKKFKEEKITTYNTEIIKQIGGKLDFLLQELDLIKNQIISQAITYDSFVNYDEKSPAERLASSKNTDSFLENMRRSFPSISNIYLIGLNGEMYSSSRNFQKDTLMEKDWIRNIRNLSFEDLIVLPHYADYADYAYENSDSTKAPIVVSFIKKIKGFNDNGTIGLVQIDLDYNEIKKITESVNVGDKGIIFIKDAENRLVYFPNEALLGSSTERINYNGYEIINTSMFSGVKDSNKAINVSYNIKSVDWTITGIIPTGSMINEFREVNSIFLYIAMFSILFAFLVSYILSKGITKPITKIIKKMKKVGEGNFDITITDTKNSDLQILYQTFNSMVKKINNLMRNIVIEESEKTNAQLKALQAQINPHFLYNTLEVVRSIALKNNVRSIVDICGSLAEMFRYNIKKNKDVVTLGEEIEHIRNYIQIQNYRYGNKFDVIYDIPKELYNFKIIRLILQPLIENAVYHGIEMKKGKGTILISCRTNEYNMAIRIEDNGLGMPAEKVDSINRALKEYKIDAKESVTKDMGIGIENVNTRIKIYYGEKYGLNVQSQLDIGTRIEIVIPGIR